METALGSGNCPGLGARRPGLSLTLALPLDSCDLGALNRVTETYTGLLSLSGIGSQGRKGLHNQCGAVPCSVPQAVPGAGLVTSPIRTQLGPGISARLHPAADAHGVMLL